MKSRIVWIDLIKVIATFSVIILHSSSGVVNQFLSIDRAIWNIANIYDSMTRMSVPLFFMLSGALLLNQRDEPLRLFFLKRFSKVVIPLIGFSIIYIFFVKYILHNNINILDHLLEIFYKKQYYHLWFLYTLIGLYLFTPILKVFIQHASKQQQIYFIVLWVFAVAILPLINKFSVVNIPNYIPMMSGYAGLFVIGYLIYNYTVGIKLFFVAVASITFSSFVTAYATYLLSVEANSFQPFFYSNLSINVLIQSISYFIVLKYIGEKLLSSNKIVSYVITPISIASFGIYLIHPMYLWLLHTKYIELHALNGYNPILMIPLTATITLLLSFVTVYFLQKIPFLKQLVP